MNNIKSPIPAVRAVVIEGDNILLVKRGHSPGKGLWSIPGGSIELGESIYDACIRELFEETNIRARPIGIINISEYIELKSKNIRYHYVLIDILMKPETSLDKAKALSDAVDVGVFKLNEALRLKLTYATRTLIKCLIKGNITILDIFGGRI